jgi:hypothetical protein
MNEWIKWEGGKCPVDPVHKLTGSFVMVEHLQRKSILPIMQECLRGII